MHSIIVPVGKEVAAPRISRCCVIGDGNRNRSARGAQIVDRSHEAVAMISRRFVVRKYNVLQHIRCTVRLDIDTSFWRRAARVGKCAAIDQNVLSGNQTEALTAVVIKSRLGHRDVRAKALPPFADVQSIAAGIVASDARNRNIVRSLDIETVPILAGCIFALSHLESASPRCTGNGNIADVGDRDHALGTGVTGSCLNGHTGVEKDLCIIRDGERLNVVGLRRGWDFQCLAAGSGRINGRLYYPSVIATLTSRSECGKKNAVSRSRSRGRELGFRV